MNSKKIIKVLIKTPAGFAEPADLKFKILKKILFKKAAIKKEMVSSKKDQIYYEIEVHERSYCKTIKSFAGFNTIVKQLFKNKKARQGIRKLADRQEDYNLLVELLGQGTTIQVLPANFIYK